MDGAKEMQLTRLAFHLRAESPIRLPRFAGSAFRGGFGAALRRTCCTMPDQDCRHCMLSAHCVYASVFETASRHAANGPYRLSDYPRPFVIEPPYPLNGPVEKGQAFVCHLLLMGNAVDLLPYFVYAFSQLGRSGLGRTRGKFSIVQVTGRAGAATVTVFDGKAGQIVGPPPVLTFAEIAGGESDCRRVTLDFLTPTRIKAQNRLTKNLTFDLLMRTLLRRLSLLFQAGGQGDRAMDIKSLLDQTGKVRCETRSLHWFDWRRYSSRQKTDMRLGGFLGAVTFEGDITPFLPYLRLGEYLHIGKAATFGLGLYEISEEEK